MLVGEDKDQGVDVESSDVPACWRRTSSAEASIWSEALEDRGYRARGFSLWLTHSRALANCFRNQGGSGLCGDAAETVRQFV